MKDFYLILILLMSFYIITDAHSSHHHDDDDSTTDPFANYTNTSELKCHTCHGSENHCHKTEEGALKFCKEDFANQTNVDGIPRQYVCANKTNKIDDGQMSRYCYDKSAVIANGDMNKCSTTCELVTVCFCDTDGCNLGAKGDYKCEEKARSSRRGQMSMWLFFTFLFVVPWLTSVILH